MRTNSVPSPATQHDSSEGDIQTVFAVRESWRGLVGRVVEALGLTPHQLTSIQPVFDKAEMRFALLRLEAMQKTQQVLDETIITIRPLLSADQRETLELCRKISKAVSETRSETSGGGRLSRRPLV